MNDLQQTTALSSPLASTSFCSSNGGLGNKPNGSSSSNCFSLSSVSSLPLPSSSYPWGTWEDLLLASAVLKHGIDNWTTVSCELQARAFLVPPSLFSAEACKGRFWILNGRFSSCSHGTIRDGKIPWFEEVRKLRVAQLKRELELYDGSIGLLQKKLNRLKAGRSESEIIVSNDALEHRNPNGLAAEDNEEHMQVSSAGDRMPAVVNPSDESLAPETISFSCITVCPAIKGDGGLEATILAPAVVESSRVSSVSPSASLSGPVFEEGNVDRHCSMVEGYHNLDRIGELTPSELQDETREPQLSPCSILESSCSLIQGPEEDHHSKNDTLSSIDSIANNKPLAIVNEAQASCGSATRALNNVHESEASHRDVSKKDNCTDRYGKLVDGNLTLKDTVTLGRAAGMERSVDADIRQSVMEDAGPECFPAQIISSVTKEDTQRDSNHSQKFQMSSAAEQAGIVSKEGDAIDDSLISASAMDLLRIAYADGTPVSTPEVAEVQPVDSEQTEELDAVEADSLHLLSDHKPAAQEVDLIGSSVSEMPCEGSVAELDAKLETTGQNQTLRMEKSIHQVSSPKDFVTVKAGVPGLGPALEPEQVSEQVCSVEGVADKIKVLSMTTEVANIWNTSVGVSADQADAGLPEDIEEQSYIIQGAADTIRVLTTEISNVSAGVSADQANAGLSEDVRAQSHFLEKAADTTRVVSTVTEVLAIKVGASADQADTRSSGDVEVQPHLVPVQALKLEPETDSLPSQMQNPSILLALQEEVVKQETQDLGIGATNNLECCENSPEKHNLSNAGTLSSETSEEKGEAKQCGDTCKQEESPSRFLSDTNLLVQDAAGTVKGMDVGSQVMVSGSPSVLEPKKRLNTPIESSSDISGIAFVEHPPVTTSDLHEADSRACKASPCNSDSRSSVVEAVSETVYKQQKSDPEGVRRGSLSQTDNQFLKVDCSSVEGRASEKVAEPNISHKQEKLEEGPVQMMGINMLSDPRMPSPSIKADRTADTDVLEEDGLLVDLMKLKGTDLSSLRKRKHLQRSNSSVCTPKDNGSSKERLDEFLVHKQLKLPRSEEVDRKGRLADAVQNKGCRSFKKPKLESRGLNEPEESLNQISRSSNVESQDKSTSKESAMEVFSTRRSRLKSRKLESDSEERDKVKSNTVASVHKHKSEGIIKTDSAQESEDMMLDVGDEESSHLEVSGLVSAHGKLVRRLESSDSRLLPDLVMLLECLRIISGHRFAPLFNLRPEIQVDANYKLLIKKHMDLNTIRDKLEEGSYSGSLEFFRDMMLIFSNALVFYSRESQEYGAARVLRENLVREMERYLRKDSNHGNPGALQAVKHNELKGMKDFNTSTSVTVSDSKRQGSIRSSCDHTICEADSDGEVDTNEVPGYAKDSGVDISKYADDIDRKKKGPKVKVPSNRGRGVRMKANESEDETLNMIYVSKERVSREKHQRMLEDGSMKLSSKKDSVSLSQGSKRPCQISSRSSRDYTPKRELSDKSRSSKYSSGRPVSAPQGRQGEPKKSLGNTGRSSRSSQQSKQTYSRGNHSHGGQPQKRARI